MAVAAACHILAGDSPAVVDDLVPTGLCVPGLPRSRGDEGRASRAPRASPTTLASKSEGKEGSRCWERALCSKVVNSGQSPGEIHSSSTGGT